MVLKEIRIVVIGLSFVMLICCAGATVTTSPLLQKHWTKDVANGPCCIMPICVNPYECYQTISCGHLCTKKEFALKKEHLHPPDYKIRLSYSRTDCHLDGCHNFAFTCNKCPNPQESDFDINNVDRLCKECYYL